MRAVLYQRLVATLSEMQQIIDSMTYDINHEDAMDHEIECEEQYRKGFSHGYEIGKNNPNLDEKINEWRYDNETRVIGAPGTLYEGRIMNEIKPSLEDGIKTCLEDVIRQFS